MDRLVKILSQLTSGLIFFLGIRYWDDMLPVGLLLNILGVSLAYQQIRNGERGKVYEYNRGFWDGIKTTD